MRRISLTVIMLCSVLLVSVVVFAEPADRVCFNGKIYTANDAQVWAGAVAVEDGKIVFVGSGKAALEYRAASTLVIDLDGKMAIPGLHDGHNQMLWGGLNRLFECRLAAGAALEKLIDKLKQCAQGQKVSEWRVAGSL